MFLSLKKYSSSSQFTCYLIASNDYDDELHVFRADDIDFTFNIVRDVQPNIIKVFDFMFDDEGYMKMLSMRDDEFIIDQVHYVHKHDHGAAEDMKLQQRIVGIDGNSNNSEDEDDHGHGHGHGDETIKKSYIFSSVRAFFVNWPYVCFSGLENYLFVIDVFDKKVLHRIATAKLKEEIQVCETFISNTKDLFIVIKKETKYIVMMLDLDAINANEGIVKEESFRFKKIFEYEES
jgi:hypothetical protein